MADNIWHRCGHRTIMSLDRGRHFLTRVGHVYRAAQWQVHPVTDLAANTKSQDEIKRRAASGTRGVFVCPPLQKDFSAIVARGASLERGRVDGTGYRQVV
jgi:hypothetical protein